MVSKRKEFFLTFLVLFVSFIPFAPLQNFNLLLSFLIIYLFSSKQNKTTTFFLIISTLVIQFFTSYFMILDGSIGNFFEVFILLEKPFYLLLFLAFFYVLMDRAKLDVNSLIIYYVLSGIGTFLLLFGSVNIHQMDILDLVFYKVDYKKVLQDFFSFNPQFDRNSVETAINSFGWAWQAIPVFVFLINLFYFLLFLRITNKKFFFLRVNFFYFQVPRYFLPIFILLWALLLINRSYPFLFEVKLQVVQYLLILISSCYLMRGYSVFRFFSRRSTFWLNLSPFKKFLILVGLFLLELLSGIVFISLFMVILVFGFLDEWKNYRKI